MALSEIIFMYSAMKNMPKRIPAYSTLNPADSSCSASSKSNGARWSSARAAMKKTMAANGWMKANQNGRWASTISPRFIELAIMIGMRTMIPRASS